MAKVSNIDVEIVENGAIIRVHQEKTKEQEKSGAWPEPAKHAVVGGKKDVLQKGAELWK